MRSTTLPVLVMLALCAALLLAAKPAAPQAAPQPAFFRPGAKVILEVTLKSPEDWKLNHLVPIRVSFDKDQLKLKAFAVSRDFWDFHLDAYTKQHTLSIPIVLSKSAADGTLSIPLDIECSICDDPGTQCAFANERMTLNLEVRAKAPAAGSEPLAKGKVSAGYRLSIPSL